MKLFVAFLLSIGFVHFAKAVEPAKSIDMSKPPFWLSSYDEMNRLRKSQKAFLIGKLAPVFEKTPALKEFTQNKLLEVIKDPDRWSDLRLKVYTYCADPAALKTCQNLADIRLETFDVDAITQIEPKSSSKSDKKK
ncbi:hypothetical protein [Bdellovibrio sp. HCB337]|uniref:hypothetical protein n=1 Tax=Bdellovibrio sp. HCB337 TaxID=3394358 RepID=UPI0039A5DCEE